MKLIRKGVFETNSSSAHSLSLVTGDDSLWFSRDDFLVNDKNEIVVKAKISFYDTDSKVEEFKDKLNYLITYLGEQEIYNIYKNLEVSGSDILAKEENLFLLKLIVGKVVNNYHNLLKIKEVFKDFYSEKELVKEINHYFDKLNTVVEDIVEKDVVDGKAFSKYPELLVYFCLKHNVVLSKVIELIRDFDVEEIFWSTETVELKDYDKIKDYFLSSLKQSTEFKTLEKVVIDSLKVRDNRNKTIKLEVEFEKNDLTEENDNCSSYSERGRYSYYGFGDEDRSSGLLYRLFENEEFLKLVLCGEGNSLTYQ